MGLGLQWLAIATGPDVPWRDPIHVLVRVGLAYLLRSDEIRLAWTNQVGAIKSNLETKAAQILPSTYVILKMAKSVDT